MAAAATTGRLLITLDRGLGDIRAYPPGSHAGVLVLRPPDQSVPAVTVMLAAHGLATLAGAIAIAQRGLRVRRTR